MPTPSFLSADSPLMRGLYTSFIDGAYADSSPILRANLLSNRPDGSEKVSSAIDDELRRCKEFFFSVAFITEGGIMPFLMTFDEMRKRHVRGRILTTDYRWFTEPAALRRLLALSDVCETRLYRCGPGEGFHTKGYFFADGGEGNCRIILGSSNLTQSALSTNCEWNVRLTAAPGGELPEKVQSEFERLWRAPQSKPLTAALIDRYAKERRQMHAYVPGTGSIILPPSKLTPNAMQRAFIESLRKMREEEHAEKALLISATGTGKTYAAAFAAKDMHPRRLLFLVHREQIARQALKSFQRVFGEPACCFGLYSGSERRAEAKYVFATVQTMSKEEHLRSFEPDAFDLIIIDEVHRAGADSYLRLMDWFTTAFWLGMTASPDRPDGFDIYKLFDNNIAYEIRLRTAMQEDLLCPFHYYGIEDVGVEGAGALDKKDFLSSPPTSASGTSSSSPATTAQAAAASRRSSSARRSMSAACSPPNSTLAACARSPCRARTARTSASTQSGASPRMSPATASTTSSRSTSSTKASTFRRSTRSFSCVRRRVRSSSSSSSAAACARPTARTSSSSSTSSASTRTATSLPSRSRATAPTARTRCASSSRSAGSACPAPRACILTK